MIEAMTAGILGLFFVLIVGWVFWQLGNLFSKIVSIFSNREEK